MPIALTDMLHDAVARNAGAVLSLPAGANLVHFKSRFLGGDNGGLWVESVPGKASWIDELISNAASVGLSFRGKPLRIVFASTMLRRHQLPLADGGATEGVLIRQPDLLSEIQRRTSYRVGIPRHFELSARVWRLADRALLRDRPSPSSEVPARIEDLSTGGMKLNCPPGKEGPRVFAPQHRLRVALSHAEGELLLEARVRRARELPDDSVDLGIEFTRMFSSPEAQAAQAKLSAVVAELQRLERRKGVKT